MNLRYQIMFSFPQNVVLKFAMLSFLGDKLFFNCKGKWKQLYNLQECISALYEMAVRPS